jgi:hypothetical protein
MTNYHGKTIALGGLAVLASLLISLGACAGANPAQRATSTRLSTATRRPALPTPEFTATETYPFNVIFEPAESGLWIQDAQVGFTDNGLIEGKFAVMNSGSDESTLGYVFCSSFTILIIDRSDQIVFQIRGAWNPPLEEGEHIHLSWDTRNNHLGEVSDSSFRPAAGRYLVKIQLEVWETMTDPTVADVETIAIEVP